MTDGIKISDNPEAPQEKLEVTEARELFDRASTDPEAAVEKTSDYKAAESLESAVVESIGPVESSAKIEIPPAITLEGAGGEGRVTIGRSAEPAAIIDSNDRISTVAIIDSNDGVAIIDSNDRTSTGAIIDSNDGISVDAIIDSNDGTSREVISTWPTPEAPNAAGEEIPPHPGGSNVMVNPSTTSGDSPIQGVNAVGGTRPSSDFNADMVDTQPGELRGFEEEDGAVSYAFTGDGILAPTEVADRVLDVENIILEEGETSREVTQDPISASSSFEDVSGLDSGSPGQTTDGVMISAAERPLQAGTGLETTTTTDLDGRTAKIIGNEPIPGLGLPIDDDISETSNENSELPQPPNINDFIVSKIDSGGKEEITVDDNAFKGGGSIEDDATSILIDPDQVIKEEGTTFQNEMEESISMESPDIDSAQSDLPITSEAMETMRAEQMRQIMIENLIPIDSMITSLLQSLPDEIDNWPEGEPHSITIQIPVRSPGTQPPIYSIQTITVTSREEAEQVLNQMKIESRVVYLWLNPDQSPGLDSLYGNKL